MKKFLALFMALVVFTSFAFFAVGSSDDEGTSGNSDVNSGEVVETPKKLTRGTITGNVYTNDFAGVSFTKPSDWTFATEEEMKETLNAGAELTDYSDLELALAETATIYDMSAKDSIGNSVLVLCENTMLSAFKKVTEDEYLDLLKSGLQTINGISYTYNGVNNVTLGNTTFKRATFTAVASGVTLNQYYYVKSFDKYVFSIIVTTTTEDVETIEAMFN